MFPLSVGGVLELHEQITYYSRHIFLRLTQLPNDSDLELLRDTGISALLYDAWLCFAVLCLVALQSR